MKNAQVSHIKSLFILLLGLISIALLTALNCAPQTGPPTSKGLPDGILDKLAPEVKEYCRDQVPEGSRLGCEKKFAAHLRWRELAITPSGPSAILVENSNSGFCGLAGCELYLFIQQKDLMFTQVFGHVGTLERVTALKNVTKGYYDLVVAWSDNKTHTTYRWDGSRYSE